MSAGVSTADARTTTNGLVTTADASTDHYLVLGLGLKEGAPQTTFNVTSVEETLTAHPNQDGVVYEVVGED